MKYGLILNKNNLNIGDDIQAFATARFLPQVDYFIDREYMDDFRPEEDEPVAVIMNAWYMWHKWNWPPAKNIIPLFVGFHYADHQLAKQPGSPIKYEFLNGIGGDYLKAYGPIGCRDYYTRDQLQALGIESYFSGCITMTIPKMPETPEKGSYICLVDLEEKVANKMKKLLAEKNMDVRVITHNRERNSEMSWEDREKQVTDLLTLYQNARCVVTKRLHCALPCLALETPVFMIKEMEDDIRFDPYYDFLHRTTVTKFMKDEYSYDFMNPPANKDDYKKYREELITHITEFVDRMKQETRGADDLVKTTYTPEEVLVWRHDVMKESMNLWFDKYRALQVDYKHLVKKYQNLQKEINRAEKQSSELSLKQKIKKIIKRH